MVCGVGDRVRGLRLLYGFSESMLCEYLDVDMETLVGIESGEVALNVVQAEKLCNLYDCSVEYLVDGGEYEKQDIVNHSGVWDLKAIGKMNQVRDYLKLLRRLERED